MYFDNPRPCVDQIALLKMDDDIIWIIIALWMLLSSKPQLRILSWIGVDKSFAFNANQRPWLVNIVNNISYSFESSSFNRQFHFLVEFHVLQYTRHL